MVIPFESPSQAPTDTLVPTPSDDPVEQLLDRVTRRLGVDRELQIEVRQELRGHLDESADELRDAGRLPAEARAEALRALGDEDDLADALWRANRRRVRVRALGAWVTRLVLPAVVVVLVAFLARGAIVAGSMLSPRVFGTFLAGPADDGRGGAGERYRAAVLADVPADVRLLFEQEGAEYAQQVALAKQLVDLKPDDPAAYANYASVVQRRQMWNHGQPRPGPATNDDNEAVPYQPSKPLIGEPLLRENLKVFAEGERREPGNGLYPAIAASLLFSASSESLLDDALDVRRPGRQHPDQWSRQVVHEERFHAEALAAARRATAAPYFRTYAAELASRKSAALPAGRVADVWVRGHAEQAHLGRAFGTGQFVFELAYHATQLAAGDRAGAERLVRELHRFAGTAAEGAATTADVHTAIWVALAADEAEARIGRAAGDAAGAERAWARLDAGRDRYRGTYAHMSRARERRLGQAGLVYADALREVLGYGDADPAPMRRAEYATLDQLGVAAVSGALLAAAGVYALAAGMQWVRARRGAGGGHAPPRLFVGWRRVAWVVGMGAVAPVVLYHLYAGIEPLSGRGDGLNETLGRVLVEYGVLALTVLLLVVALARRAAVGRMEELGVSTRVEKPAVPAWRRSAPVAAVVLAGLCLAGVLVLAAGVFYDVPRTLERVGVPALLVAAWASIAFAAAAAGGASRRDAATRSAATPAPVLAGTVARSAFPVVVVAALVVALAGLPLRRVEAEHVSAVIAGSGALVSEKAVGESGYDAIRAELIREHAAGNARDAK